MAPSRTRGTLSHDSGGNGNSKIFLSVRTIRVLALGLALGRPLAPSGTALSHQSAKGANPEREAVQSVDSVGMTVSDIDRSVAFYSQVLSFDKVSDMELAGSEYEHLEGIFGLRMRVVRMRLGSEFIELSEYLAPRGRPMPPDSRSNDRWFQHIAIVTSDMDRASSWLRQNKVRQVSSGPQVLPEYIKAAAGIRAFYFEDPDGHPLEVLQFPPDKGDARWHQTASQLFLGVDHTAIVVDNTEASLKFYRDGLGFRVSGESENYGPEQEHLNSVFGARLRITSLRASSGPGVELLEYLAPTNGRSTPADEQASDLVHHETRLVTTDIEPASRSLRQARLPFISSAIVLFPKAEAGFHRALLVRDPDGHPIELVEK